MPGAGRSSPDDLLHLLAVRLDASLGAAEAQRRGGRNAGPEQERTRAHHQ